MAATCADLVMTELLRIRTFTPPNAPILLWGIASAELIVALGLAGREDELTQLAVAVYYTLATVHPPAQSICPAA